jgi:pimeloyl-ACP methyl ester carboxylesterase
MFEVRSRADGPDDARRIAGTLGMEQHAADLVAPLLIVFGRQDRLIPWQQAERLRDSVAGPAELLMLEQGNHGCANVTPWHRPYTADWVATQLHDHHTLTTNAKAGV